MSLKTPHAPQTFNIDRLSHAYIVPDAVTGAELSMAVICNSRAAEDGSGGGMPCMKCKHCDKAVRDIHPDIVTVKRLDDKREIVVEQIRKLQQDIFFLPNEASHKVYIVHDADSMNRSAQNAFLQILEEPPSYVVFLLCAANPAALLPTVRSRCIELKAQPIADSSDFADSGKADELNEVVRIFLTSLGCDNYQLINCMFKLEKLDKLSFSAFLASAREQIVLSLRNESKLRDDSKLWEGSRRRILVNAESVLVKAEEMLALNVNTGHISGMICASLLK